MATSQTIGQRFAQFRNFVLEVTGLASEVAAVTATGNGTTAGAATLNAMVGQVTSEALTTAAAAEYSLTLTNNKIAAGDLVFASVDGNGGTNSPGLGQCKVTANTVVISVSNLGAGAFDAAIKINFLVVKKLTTITPNF